MSQIGNKAFRDYFSLLTYSWWFYNSPEIRFGGVAMTSDAHEATEWTMLSHIQLLSFVCLFVFGGGLKKLSQGRGNGNRETITGKKKFNTNMPLICRRSCSPSRIFHGRFGWCSYLHYADRFRYLHFLWEIVITKSFDFFHPLVNTQMEGGNGFSCGRRSVSDSDFGREDAGGGRSKWYAEFHALCE